jgi:hypothetical protein
MGAVSASSQRPAIEVGQDATHEIPSLARSPQCTQTTGDALVKGGHFLQAAIVVACGKSLCVPAGHAKKTPSIA